jgi:hypothetical protein
MAGFYPDVPANRMAYDLDGTQFYEIADRNFEKVNPAPWGNIAPIDRTSECPTLNNEDLTDWMTTPIGGAGYVLIFPELRDLQGSSFMFQSWQTGQLAGQTSVDTTNGVDGTWLSYAIGEQIVGAKDDLRTIGAATALGVRALRFQTHYGGAQPDVRNIAALHLYGTPASGENLQRLELWHPTLDQSLEAAALDWGDVPRLTEETRTFRVKNLHGSLTANTPTITTNILTDTTPSIPAQITYSDDDATWLSQITIANLAPGAISPLLYHRRLTPDDANLSLWWYRILPIALSWA